MQAATSRKVHNRQLMATCKHLQILWTAGRLHFIGVTNGTAPRVTLARLPLLYLLFAWMLCTLEFSLPSYICCSEGVYLGASSNILRSRTIKRPADEELAFERLGKHDFPSSQGIAAGRAGPTYRK